MPIADVYEDGKRITVIISSLEKEKMREIPGANWSHKISAWTLPLSWASCVTLRGVFGDRLEVKPGLTEWAANEYENRVAPSVAWRNQLDSPYGDARLFPFQRAGVEFLAWAKRAMIIDEMGCGKTRQALKAVQRFYELGYDPFPVLVVTPNSVKQTWKREAAEVWKGLEVQVIRGSANERRKQMEASAHIFVLNWEALRLHSRLAPYGSISLRRCKECGGEDERITPTRCEVHKRELNYINFNTVIADEIHRSKAPQAKQTRALWAATGDAQFRIGLTGTPISNSPDDLWSVLHWLSPEEFSSRNAYIDRWCLKVFNTFGSPEIIGLRPDTQEEFYKIVDPRMRRMTKEVVLPFLPPIIRERRDVEMAPKQKKAYVQMRDKQIAELEGVNLDENQQIIATSPLARLVRQMQFSSSYATIEEKWNPKKEKMEEFVRLAEPSNKIDAFMDDIEDFGNDSVVVFAVSRQLIELLSHKMETHKISHGLITGAQNTEERQEAIDDFQAGKTKFILCTIQAGGVGLTLTKGNVAVFLQRSWSAIDNSQAEARVHRIGSEQHSTIRIIDYVTTDTVEDAQIDAIHKKSARLEQITRDKDLLKRVLELGKLDDDTESDGGTEAA